MLTICESSSSPSTQEEKGKQIAKTKRKRRENEEKWMERAEWQKSKLKELWPGRSAVGGFALVAGYCDGNYASTQHSSIFRWALGVSSVLKLIDMARSRIAEILK